MKVKFALVVAFTLSLTASGYAAGSKFGALFTFACNGKSFWRSGPCPVGGRPDSLFLGSDGNFYGAAQVSGEGDSAPLGGKVFSLTPTGKLTVLHTFAPGANKNYPNGTLPGLMSEGPDGKIYGETLYGGNGGCNGYCGYGVLYRVNRDGTGFQVVHKYCSETNCTDGFNGGALVTGTDGNVYGTTYYGGTYNEGTIFKVTPSTGAYEVLTNFNLTLGENPSGMVVASDGSFYGTSFGSQGEMLFHYTESTGQITVVPMNFPLFNGLPSSGSMLTIGASGNFYGIYGIYGREGSGVFEIEPDGSNLQLFSFYSTQAGAGSPQAMLLASDGNFWVTNYNGTSGYGSILTISPADGTVIQTFSPFSSTAAVGAYPAELIQAPNGVLWGSTYSFGNVPKNYFGDGTVFSLNAGLPPK